MFYCKSCQKENKAPMSEKMTYDTCDGCGNDRYCFSFPLCSCEDDGWVCGLCYKSKGFDLIDGKLTKTESYNTI